MLGRMHSAAIDTPSTTRPTDVTSFAGLLNSMRDPAYNDDGLADDVASISYEHALRKQARSRVDSCASDGDPEQVTNSVEANGADSRDPAPRPRALKSASITIRLSESEFAQVRQRAAEAGLTVSAYLRSCTLEVESLRAQVKQTVAQLRNSASAAPALDRGVEKPRRLRSILAHAWHWIRAWGSRRQERQDAIVVNPANPFAPVRY